MQSVVLLESRRVSVRLSRMDARRASFPQSRFIASKQCACVLPIVLQILWFLLKRKEKGEMADALMYRTVFLLSPFSFLI